ncbi:MAG TPA: alginate export family protein [Planctomycetota bacterium]|nr:alginate export family protein [Planctomycetota bacterium]
MVRFLTALMLVVCLGSLSVVAAEEPDLTNPDPFAQFWNNIMKHPFKGSPVFSEDTTFGYMMQNLEIGAYLRGRYESTEIIPVRTVFGPQPTLNQVGDKWADWFAYRALFHATIPLTPDLGFFVEGTHMNVAGENNRFKRTPGGADYRDPQMYEPSVALYQYFAQWDDIFTRGVSLKGGRQEIVCGDEWLIGDNDFYSGLSFDAVKLSIHGEQATLDLLAAEVADDLFAPRGDTDPRIYGFYGSYSIVESTATIDFFGFYNTDKMNKADVAAGGIGKSTFANEDRYTFGGRLWGVSSDVDYDVKAAYQLGRTGSTSAAHYASDINAYAFECRVGKTYDVDLSPRIGAKAAYASGDNNRDDGDAKAFNPLYQDFHGRYGYADVFAFSNLIDYALELSIQPYEKMTLGAEGHLLQSAKRPEHVSSKLAKELDLFCKYQATANLGIEAAYVMFLQDEAFEDTAGTREHNQRVYVNLEYAF